MIRPPPRSTQTATLCPLTTLFRSQMGKASPSDADKPEEVGVQHSAIIVVAALFEWTEDDESLSVPHHIHPPAQQANRLFDRRHGLIRMVDVKRNNKGAPRCPGLYLLRQRHVAQRAEHDVTAVKGRIHQATAKASGNAGYEPGFRSLAVHPQSSLLCVRPQPDAAWLRCQLWSGYMKDRKSTRLNSSH